MRVEGRCPSRKREDKKRETMTNQAGSETQNKGPPSESRQYYLWVNQGSITEGR